MAIDRREFLRLGAAAAVGAGTVPVSGAAAAGAGPQGLEGRPDYTLKIATGLVELAPQHIVSTTLYNGQFPGPLLRFKEGLALSLWSLRGKAGQSLFPGIKRLRCRKDVELGSRNSVLRDTMLVITNPPVGRS